MDSMTNRHADVTQKLRLNAELKLHEALAVAFAASREIAELYADNDLDLVCIAKYNAGEITTLDAKNVMGVLIHRAALRQLFIRHNERGQSGRAA